MKKWMDLSILVIMGLVLSACGRPQSSTATATESTSLSLEAQLLVGTLKLESTDQTVDAAQAKTLLPLWETLASLSMSSTSAQQEVDAVVSQIKSSMTSDQLSAITAMKLTRQDLQSAIMDSGAALTTTSSKTSNSSSSVQFQAGSGMPADGAPAGGNPPADMGAGMPLDSAMQSASTSGSNQTSANASSGTVSQVSPALINALVALLVEKTA
jgi:hypothetical protein